MATKSNRKTTSFREQLGDAPIGIDDFKVDELRKLASEFHIGGSHGLKKPQLVEAINKARLGDRSEYDLAA